MPNSLQAIDFAASLRPIRNAYLVSSSAGLDWVRDDLNPGISCRWAGAYSFIFPIFDTLENHRTFEPFLDLLAKFDPDAIHSTGSFPQPLLDRIRSRVLIADEIFQFNANAVPLPSMPVSRETWAIPAETLWRQRPGLALIDYVPTGDPLFDVWFYSRVGRLGLHHTEIQAANVAFTQQPINRAAVEGNLNDFMTRVDDSWPLWASMSFLGARGARSHYFDHDLPEIIIIGDTLGDWALYQTLQYMRTKVYWFPAAYLGQTPATSYDSQLFRLISRNATSPRVFTSVSLLGIQLTALLQQHLTSINRYHWTPQFTVEVNFAGLVNEWRSWGEPNNYVDSTLVFNNSLSLQYASPLVPKSFRLQPADARYFVNLSPVGYSYLVHGLCREAPVQWRNPQGTVPSDARKTDEGGIAFNPIHHLIMPGQALDSSLISPRIKLADLLDEFSVVASNINLRPVESDKTKTVRSALALWNSDVEQFCTDVIVDGSREVFEAFKVGANVARRSFLTVQYGISIGQEVLLSLPLSAGFQSGVPTVNSARATTWIDNDILVRGLLLFCSVCGHRDFYQESEITNQFSCKKCIGRQVLKSAAFRSDEPRFLYRLNPLISALQRESSDVVLWGVKKLKDSATTYFEWTSEIELHSAAGATQELDLVANVDGRLVVGEAKSNGQLRNPQLHNYVDLCRALRISRFLCITLGRWNPGTRTAISAAFRGAPLTMLEFLEGP